VHASTGSNIPATDTLLSEPAIVCGIAQATLGSAKINWQAYADNYDRIRSKIAATIPGFEDFNVRVREPHGFYLGNSAAERQWKTASGRAQFRATQLPQQLPHEIAQQQSQEKVFTLQTMRSHDQYNTPIYGLDDRYRGIYGQRKVLMMNAGDIAALGFADGDLIDMFTVANDDIERSVQAFRITRYDIPAGNCAAYYPETNPLVPLSSYGDRSFTPTSKAITVILRRHAG